LAALNAPPVADGAARYAFPRHRTAQITFVLLAVYVVYAAAQMEVSWERVQAGLEHAARFLSRMFPPNFERSELLWKGLAESLQIAVLASALGIVLALPFGLLGARNLMPAWISWPARLIVVLARSFHPVVVAIVFVKAVGFGALAGVLALTVASIGFIGKLFTEAIEEVSIRQVEAIRATGAPFTSVLAFGVLPQVFSRFIGFATYQLDSNLRNSTMVGIVGAGGIGGTLFAAFQRFDYDFVAAILISLIALIMAGEVLATAVRRIFIDNVTLGGLFRGGTPASHERHLEDD
jgi:phosphonate transport system permease protein